MELYNLILIVELEVSTVLNSLFEYISIYLGITESSVFINSMLPPNNVFIGAVCITVCW